jgi:hypothetical protein
VVEPTPITKRKHVTRPKRVKLAAVMAAEMVGVVEASKQMGIPATSIEVWLKKPEYAAIRTKTREDLADEVKLAAHLAWRRVIDTADTMEPRDAIFAAEKAATILQLLSGGATSRTETRDLTARLNEQQADQLMDDIDAWLALRAEVVDADA